METASPVNQHIHIGYENQLHIKIRTEYTYTPHINIPTDTSCMSSYIHTPHKCCYLQTQSINQSINPLACTECGDSLPFSGASSIPPCHTLFPATPLRRPFFHPPSLHPAICFLVLLFPNSYIVLFWEFYFLPFSVHVQTIVIYAALLSLL